MDTLVKLFKFYTRYLPLKFGLVITLDMQYLKRKRDLNLLAQDYVRSSTLELIAHEIHRRGVKGSLAELGVYRGDFAWKINKLFPDRKLCLFDTFEGFYSSDKHIDIEKGYSDGTQDFSDTSISLVLSKMPFKENVIIKKGYFPESAKDVEDLFCFVSIDVDLYQPTKAGLEYFYPRLLKGGYILVHDFNNDGYLGVREAIYEFCDKESISFVPVSDVAGSCIIAK